MAPVHTEQPAPEPGTPGDGLASVPARRRHKRVFVILGAFGLSVAIVVASLLFLVVGARHGDLGSTGSMSIGRIGDTATLLSEGRVLITGGYDGQYLASAEIYDPKTRAFSPTGSMGTTRSAQTATLLANGEVLIAGGEGTDGYLSSAELYDPKTGTFSPAGRMVTGGAGQTATLLADGRVLLAGGFDESGDPSASAELYDPNTGTFSPTGALTVARQGQTATLLPDGQVLIVGGMSKSGYLASAELYDPKIGTFSPTGTMTAARQYHTATVLSNGQVLVAGGGNYLGEGWSVLTSAELYDSKTGTFSPTGPLSTARENATSTLLSDGRVLIAGGDDNYNATSILASAELYDPATGTFSPTGSMGTPRESDTATLLSDGRVLIVGGSDAHSHAIASAELYDPAIGTFSPPGSMGTVPKNSTATLLPDSRVLIVGGPDAHLRTIAPAETYT